MPNLEVREAFYLNIIAEFTENEDYAESAYWRIKDSLKAGDLRGVLEILRNPVESDRQSHDIRPLNPMVSDQRIR